MSGLDSQGPVVDPNWQPDPALAAETTIAGFAAQLTQSTDEAFYGYGALRVSSAEHLEEIWAEIWDFFNIHADGDPSTVSTDATMPGAQSLPGTRLNHADHAPCHGLNATHPRRPQQPHVPDR